MPERTAILVIDDDPSSLANLKLLLELESFNVYSATDGTSGLAVMRAKRPDIVICDILMPGINGLDLLVEVRRDAAIAATPFIFLSALSDYEHLRQGMNRGADDYLVKPFAAYDLLAAIAVRLNRLRLPTIANQAQSHPQRALIESKLTGREVEVFRLIGNGYSSRLIAGRLGVSVRTVDSHRASIIAKLEVDGATGLIRLASTLGSTDGTTNRI